jgi:hypothetical protein
MVEWQDLLNGYLAATRLVEGSGHSSVCAFTDGVQELVIIAYNRKRSDMGRGEYGRASTDLELGQRLVFAGRHGLQTPDTSRWGI